MTLLPYGSQEQRHQNIVFEKSIKNDFKDRYFCDIKILSNNCI
jgi:hypothetical protein